MSTRFRLVGTLAITVLTAVCSTTFSTAGQAHAQLRVPLGVASVSTMLPAYDYASEAAQIRSVGATFIRIPAKWNLIQPANRGAYNWSALDTAVSAARANGLAVLMNLEGPAPVWAQKTGADPNANGNGPQDPYDFSLFARQLALRYSSQVSAWEVWNEPNLSHYLLPPTAAAYIPLLRAAYTGLHSVGATQPVITGGTSSSRAETRDTTFINDLYQQGAKGYFDAIGVHPYTFPYPIESDPRYGDGGGANVIPVARSIMVANGDADKNLWVTEFGQPTGSTYPSTSETAQADILTDAITRGQQLSWIGALFIFNSVDLTADKTWSDGNMGLFRFDGSPKPAVAAIQRLTR